MAATQTANIITAIRKALDDIEAEAAGSGLGVTTPLSFAAIADLAARGAASSQAEFGEEL